MFKTVIQNKGEDKKYRIYNTISDKQRVDLLRLVIQDKLSLKQAAELVKIKYSSAKTIIRVLRSERRILKKVGKFSKKANDKIFHIHKLPKKESIDAFIRNRLRYDYDVSRIIEFVNRSNIKYLNKQLEECLETREKTVQALINWSRTIDTNPQRNILPGANFDNISLESNFSNFQARDNHPLTYNINISNFNVISNGRCVCLPQENKGYSTNCSFGLQERQLDTLDEKRMSSELYELDNLHKNDSDMDKNSLVLNSKVNVLESRNSTQSNLNIGENLMNPQNIHNLLNNYLSQIMLGSQDTNRSKP